MLDEFIKSTIETIREHNIDVRLVLNNINSLNICDKVVAAVEIDY